MPKEASYKKSAQVELILYIFLVGFVLFFPLLIGLALRAFEESFIKGQALEFGSYLANFLTYIPFILGSITLIIFPISELWFLGDSKKHPSTTGGAWYTKLFTASYVHSPEKNGLLSYIFVKAKNFLKNPIRLFWWSILLFGLFGILLIGNPQLAVSGVPQLQLQQVTPASEVTFTALVPAWGENASLLFFFMLFMGINQLVLSRLKNKSIYVYFGIGFIICLLMGGVWLSYHLIAYSSSEASLIGTFIFGFMGSLITMLTGSLIPFFVWHLMNNAFLTLRDLVSLKEDLLLVSIVIWAVLLLITIGIKIYKKKNKKIVNGISN